MISFIYFPLVLFSKFGVKFSSQVLCENIIHFAFSLPQSDLYKEQKKNAVTSNSRQFFGLSSFDLNRTFLFSFAFTPNKTQDIRNQQFQIFPPVNALLQGMQEWNRKILRLSIDSVQPSTNSGLSEISVNCSIFHSNKSRLSCPEPSDKKEGRKPKWLPPRCNPWDSSDSVGCFSDFRQLKTNIIYAVFALRGPLLMEHPSLPPLKNAAEKGVVSSIPESCPTKLTMCH